MPEPVQASPLDGMLARAVRARAELAHNVGDVGATEPLPDAPIQRTSTLERQRGNAEEVRAEQDGARAMRHTVKQLAISTTPLAQAHAAQITAPLPAAGNRAVAALIQRQLRVIDGSEEDVATLCQLLGPPAGLELDCDGSSITIKCELTDAKSPTLRARLKQIIADPHHHAQISMASGSLPMLGTFAKPAQKLYANNLRTVETQTLGAGVAAAIHEIWENYQSWVQGSGGQQGQYGPAHESAVTVESATLTEIYPDLPSNRVAAATAGTGTVREPFVIDYQTYFLLFTPLTSGSLQSQRRERETVAQIAVDDFEQNEANLSTVAQSTIKKAVEEFLAGRLATACVTGWRTGTETSTVSEKRARAVATYIVNDVLDDARWENKGIGADVGSVQAWSRDGGVRDTPGVTILIEKAI